MARIELEQVGLTFRVRKDKRRQSLKGVFIGGLLGRSEEGTMTVEALREVSLSVGQGERLGVLGHNGAGKSTLLKMLAGVYPPTKGRRLVEGRISSLFDISLGFEVDSSGWENIAYRCYLQGESPRSVRQKRQGIADFSELGDFLNMPVRYYSAGMLVKLAFSIATSMEPEVLLVDEVLSVGDMAFQEKARARMREMMSKAHLIVMVSHDLDSLCRVCDRAVWMDHGQVRGTGPVAEIVEAYKASVAEARPQAA
jgi:ABC-type polysaccharide/polyol phosphate transport system ATPase subunit